MVCRGCIISIQGGPPKQPSTEMDSLASEKSSARYCTIAAKFNIPVHFFTEWKWSIYFNFIQFIKNNYRKDNPNYEKYDYRNIKDSIKALQEQFIITPIDKAAGNFAIICKKFYLQILDKELKSSETYKLNKSHIITIKK
ncbi:hypothetical protein AVEN_152956-1 [Araneus ventricosus]|uniref:Uncharacterized protein n=1 Tax=Araneus ventricosus TaxID=182803 RepID=A0A4Y2AD12_ARAVE|nr:hypothetical protein AVEN_152956-1 [Araneus ventricosus]